MAAELTESVAIPQSLDEADALIARLGQISRDIDQATSRQDARIAKIKESTKGIVDPLTQQRTAIMQALEQYARLNRTPLTEGGKTKTVIFRHGTIRWRISPVAIQVIGKAADVIADLKRRRGGKACIRIKEELDLNELKKHPEIVKRSPGLEFTQHEAFIVVPHSTSSEVVLESAPFTVRHPIDPAKS